MLASWIFWTAVACCAAAQIAIFRSTLLARAATGSDAVPRSGRAAEMLWVILPALMLAAVLFFTWRALDASPAGAAPNASASTALHQAAVAHASTAVC